MAQAYSASGKRDGVSGEREELVELRRQKRVLEMEVEMNLSTSRLPPPTAPTAPAGCTASSCWASTWLAAAAGWSA